MGYPISVIMPVYNMEAYVAAAIDSILNQTFSDFEFIIVNDGSTDRSRDIIHSYRSDSRIAVLNLAQQRGNNVARNRGMNQARGRYICVMDADDIASPERLKVEFEYMESHPNVLAAGTHYSFMGTGYEPVKPQDYDRIREALLTVNCFLHPSLIIRTDCLRSIGGYDESLLYSSDYDLMCRLALIGPIVNLPDNLMSYRLHPTQISTAHRLQQLQYAHKPGCKYQVALINQLVERTSLPPITLAEVGCSEMGQAIYCFVYGKTFDRPDYNERGEQLLAKVYDWINQPDFLRLEEKLIAVGCGLIYLLRNGFVEGDEDEVLEDVDRVLLETKQDHTAELSYYLNLRASK